MPKPILVSLRIASRLLLLLSLTASSYALAQPFEQVAPGASHICALDAAGQVECTTTPIAKRFLPPEDLPLMTQIVAGQQHTCGITLDGAVECWGEDVFGVLDVPQFDVPVVTISAGLTHTCAVDVNGAVQCWGLDTNDQLEAPEVAGGFVKVDAARNGTCGIDTNADIRCWSNDAFFQPGSTIAGPFIDLDIDSNKACGLTANGNISCWAARGRTNLTPPDGGPYTDLTVTNSAICGLRTDQLLECSFSVPTTPSYILDTRSEEYPLDVAFSSIERSNMHFGGVAICGVRADNGTISCFGGSDQRDGNLPAPPGSAPGAPVINASNITLGLTASIYGANQVELFWSRVPYLLPQILVEVYRDDELLLQTTNSFSYYDNDNSVSSDESRYKVRTIDEFGNVGRFSNDVVVNRSSFEVTVNGGPDAPVNPGPERSLQIQDFTVTTFGQFLVSNDTYILSWNIDNPAGIPIAGYEIQIDNEPVGFTTDNAFVGGGFDAEVCQVYSVVAIGEDGAILDFNSKSRGGGQIFCF